jgi:iron complex outermembrane receptor protein
MTLPLRVPGSLMKLTVLTTASALALSVNFTPSVSRAQGQNAQTDLQELIVTGTRIIRDGYQAPTPLTVVTAEALAAGTATANVADTLNTMPVFANSDTPAGGVSGVSGGTQGLNVLNLRGMGGNRTLTLLDGQRSVPAVFSGGVDINNFPQQLILRVDTVTGGGSAVYGSDAVAGVVNIILDKQFTGLKGEVSGGGTTYGDDLNYKVSLAGGFDFGGGRGHVLLSAEMADREGVTPGDGGRKWNYQGWGIMTNPAYGTGPGQSRSVPEQIVRDKISLSNATHGGIIVSGPLRGIAFGHGGVPYQFNYGPLTLDPWMRGGDWESTEIRHDRSGSLEPENTRHNAFFRIAYDVTDNVNVHAQALWGDNITYTATWPPFQAGNGATILSGNPFIPATVQAQMTALGLTSFRIGSMNYDMPTVGNLAKRITNRYVVGADGKFDAADTTWSWNAYYQYGKTRATTDVENVLNMTRWALATDAVRAPNGQIVCRSTLTNPTNGCVPWNNLGTGVNDVAGLKYITGLSHVNQNISQNVFAGSITGEPFSTWAGPVSLALSAEHRSEKAVGKPDPAQGTFTWFAGNFSPFAGKTKVTEGAAEAVVPLAKGESWADTLDVNGAIRITDYQLSGMVTTWKGGAVYAPIPEIKFRGTISRDIRAPSFNELFAVNNSGFRSAFDPFTNTTPQFFGENRGNLNLRPEKADTREVGIILSPSFMSGLTVSVDYWHIKLKDAVGSAGDNDVLAYCFQGRTEFCAAIQRDGAGIITKLTQQPFNLAAQEKAGIDVEGSYSTSVSDLISAWSGDLSLRTQWTFYTKSTLDEGLGAGPFSTLGNAGAGTAGSLLNGPPRWRSTTTLGYALDALKTSLTFRWQSSGHIDGRYIVCSTACPVSGAIAKTIEQNYTPGFFYIDASLAYTWEIGGSEVETFFNVRNLMNTDPGIVPQGPTNFTYVFPLSRSHVGYDILGRVMRAGVRFRM